jgi:RNA-splicing ligase RtcB
MARFTHILAKARAVSGAFESRWGRRIMSDSAEAVERWRSNRQLAMSWVADNRYRFKR